MAILNWIPRNHSEYTFLEFKIAADLLRPSDLPETALPQGLENRRHLGLILSGQGPVWLYGHLVHLAHPFAWVAVYDPRLRGGVVVMNHMPDGPSPGTVVPVAD